MTRKQQIASIGEDAEKRESSGIISGTVNLLAIMENGMDALQRKKERKKLLYNFTSKYLPEEKKNHKFKKILTHLCSLQHYLQ